uniref:Uncharacterized protein n=1 Tax=Heterorhabditis bacteriophora TaxID=37862 RepID=A0A1I7X1N7_HETBA
MYFTYIVKIIFSGNVFFLIFKNYFTI